MIGMCTNHASFRMELETRPCHSTCTQPTSYDYYDYYYCMACRCAARRYAPLLGSLARRKVRLTRGIAMFGRLGTLCCQCSCVLPAITKRSPSARMYLICTRGARQVQTQGTRSLGRWHDEARRWQVDTGRQRTSAACMATGTRSVKSCKKLHVYTRAWACTYQPTRMQVASWPQQVLQSPRRATRAPT